MWKKTCILVPDGVGSTARNRCTSISDDLGYEEDHVMGVSSRPVSSHQIAKYQSIDVNAWLSTVGHGCAAVEDGMASKTNTGMANTRIQ